MVIMDWYKINAQAGVGRTTAYLYGVILHAESAQTASDQVAAKPFIDQLNTINNPIDLRFNTPGGSLVAGIAIHNAISRHSQEVVGHIDGLCASAGSYISLACRRVVMADNALMMLHGVQGGARGNSQTVQDAAEMMQKANEILAQGYAKKMNSSVSDALKLMSRDTWLTAGEALKLGLADEIVEGSRIAAAWNEVDIPGVNTPALPELTLEQREEVEIDAWVAETNKLAQGVPISHNSTTPEDAEMDAWAREVAAL